MERPNEVTIFSNGIADFRRSYRVGGGQSQAISLNVHREHVGDVLASLCVFGDVRVPAPPTFAPANREEGELTLDATNVIEGLACQLPGAVVSVERAVGSVRGTLMGLHQESQATGGESVLASFLVLLTDEGLAKLPLREVLHLRFDDESIQGEIQKALSRSLSAIKPDSTQIQLTVETDQEEAEAVLQYTVPAAAWKISYRLRDDEQGRIHLQGFAVVDNNTEEDWDDFFVSVVTGEPITFSTDLAEAKTPQRAHVNVVRDEALGAVEVEAAMRMSLEEDDEDRIGALPAPRGASRQMAVSMMAEEPGAAPDRQEAAEWEAAEGKEVGDYSIYRSSRPFSIPAHRSIIFPVFDTTLDDCRLVLYYKREDHDGRPYRAARWKHAGGQSLGRGVCTVFQEQVYAGSCVFPATRPGEERLLPYALETGVRVLCEQEPAEQTLARIHFSEGHGYTSTRWKRRTIYSVESSRDEQHALVLDHEVARGDVRLTCRLLRRDDDGEWTTLDAEHVQRLKNGRRIETQLAPRGRLTLELTETRVIRSAVDLAGSLNVRWLRHHVLTTNGPLSNDPDVVRCAELQLEMDGKARAMEQVEQKIHRLEERQERLRKNIQVGGEDEQTGRWRSELGRAEDEITALQQQRIPELQSEKESLQNQLRQALRDLSASWQEA